MATHHRRWPWIAAGSVVVVAVAGGVFFWLTTRDEVTDVSVDSAVSRFDDGDGSSGTTVVGVGGLTLPAPGVYTYTTSGSESVDALGGTTHTYPASTALTVKASGCGVTVTWEPLEHRTETWTACLTDDGVTVASYGSEHEFFQNDNTTAMTCPTPYVLLPADATTAAHPDAVTCTGDGLSDAVSVSVGAPAKVTVGGTDVEGVTVTITSTTTGSTTGTSTRSLVLDPTTGLPLTWHDDTTNTSTTPIGAVHYKEEFTLTLTSLTPQT